MRRESDDKFLVMAAGAGGWRLEFVDLVDRERTKCEIRERDGVTNQFFYRDMINDRILYTHTYI